MSDFERALDSILRMEVAPDGTTYSNRKDDDGGPTNFGITHLTYTGWLDDHKKPHRGVCECGNPEHADVRLITEEEVQAIYFERYWSAARCQEFPWPLSMLVFDSAVNQGPSTAIILLQRALMTQDDGVIGPKTREALGFHVIDHTIDVVCYRYLLFRIFHYREITKKKPQNRSNLVDFWLPRMRKLLGDMDGAKR